MNRDEYVETIKATALQMGSKLVMSWLVARAPFLALRVVNPVVGYVVSKILEIAIRETEFGAFYLYIDFRTSKQGRDFFESALKNQEIQNSGTPEEKANAEANLMARFRAFVRFTN